MQKICAGRCGQLKDEEEFDWNPSRRSRKNKCVPCLRQEGTERTAAYRKARRPADWQPKVSRVDCQGADHPCGTCKKVKSHDEFYVDKTSSCGFESRCKDCRREQRRDRWRDNTNGHRDKEAARMQDPERRAIKAQITFVSKLKRDFNITEDQYFWLLLRQHNVCALCREPETRIHPRSGTLSRLSVDHDHRCCPQSAKSCGKCVRGLLCHACNMFMGKVEEKPALAERFKDYVDNRPLEEYVASGFYGWKRTQYPEGVDLTVSQIPDVLKPWYASDGNYGVEIGDN